MSFRLNFFSITASFVFWISLAGFDFLIDTCLRTRVSNWISRYPDKMILTSWLFHDGVVVCIGSSFWYNTASDGRPSVVCIVPTLWAGRCEDRIPVGARFSGPLPALPKAHPEFCIVGTGSFSVGVNRPGRGVEPPPPHLAPMSNISIPLFVPLLCACLPCYGTSLPSGFTVKLTLNERNFELSLIIHCAYL